MRVWRRVGNRPSADEPGWAPLLFDLRNSYYDEEGSTWSDPGVLAGIVSALGEAYATASSTRQQPAKDGALVLGASASTLTTGQRGTHGFLDTPQSRRGC